MHVIFYLVLSWVRYLHKICLHIVHKTKNSWNYSNNPLQKFGNPWFLYCVWLPGWSRTVLLFSVGCSWVPCLFWTVELSTVLQTNPPRSVDSAVFQHLCIFEPFPAVTVWFWDPSFHTEDNWWTQTQLLKKVQTFTDAPEEHTMHKRWLLKTFEQDEDFQLISFVEIYIFFHLLLPFGSNRRYLHVFPEDKLSTIYLDLQIQKVFTPRLLMHRVFSGASVNVWTFF